MQALYSVRSLNATRFRCPYQLPRHGLVEMNAKIILRARSRPTKDVISRLERDSSDSNRHLYNQVMRILSVSRIPGGEQNHASNELAVPIHNP